MSEAQQFDSMSDFQGSQDPSSEYSTRLEFLYRIVADTQDTIRFLDTKAGFCVTLITAMIAATFGPLSRAHTFHTVHLVAIGLFCAAVLITLALCLKVIFPTIHLQGAFSTNGHTSPAFFLPHRHSRTRVIRSVWSGSGNPLSVTYDEYQQSVLNARDVDLLHSMCDEVFTVSALRQVKAERLRAAIIGLMATVGLFFVQLIF